MPRKQKPDHFEPMTTYSDLRLYVRKFAEGHFNCLVFVGPPGRLKSSIIRSEVGDGACYIKGNARPFEVFCRIQTYVLEREPQLELVVVDDADKLYGEPDGQRLMNQVTDPIYPKLVDWPSIAPTNVSLEKQFETRCRTIIIDNAWNTQNERILALEDRARLFLFDPSPKELHAEVGRHTWFTDKAVYDFVGANLHFLSDLSARVYVKAKEEKDAGLDWRKYILKQCTTPDDMELLLLEYDPTWQSRSVDRKAKEWCRRTGRSRATYFNRKRELVE